MSKAPHSIPSVSVTYAGDSTWLNELGLPMVGVVEEIENPFSRFLKQRGVLFQEIVIF